MQKASSTVAFKDLEWFGRGLAEYGGLATGYSYDTPQLVRVHYTFSELSDQMKFYNFLEIQYGKRVHKRVPRFSFLKPVCNFILRKVLSPRVYGRRFLR